MSNQPTPPFFFLIIPSCLTFNWNARLILVIFHYQKNRKVTGVSRVQVDKSSSSSSKNPMETTRPVRRVHFATAELRPDIGSDSSDDDNLSSYHVSLLPSRRIVDGGGDEIRDGGSLMRQEKWWRNEAYYAALAIPIF